MCCVALPERGALAHASTLGWRCEKAAMLLMLSVLCMRT